MQPEDEIEVMYRALGKWEPAVYVRALNWRPFGGSLQRQRRVRYHLVRLQDGEQIEVQTDAIRPLRRDA